jgi:hypothetical protein
VGWPWAVVREVRLREAVQGGPLHLAAALATAFASDGSLALPLPLGTGFLVKATLAKLRVKTRPLHLSFEPAERSLEALAVLNRYFQRMTTPLRWSRIGNIRLREEK